LTRSDHLILLILAMFTFGLMLGAILFIVLHQR